MNRKKRRYTIISCILLLLFAVSTNHDNFYQLVKFATIDSVNIELNPNYVIKDLYGEPKTVVTYKNGTKEQLGNMSYSTSDSEIISIDENGGIKGKKVGNVTISTTYMGRKAEKEIAVKDYDKVLEDMGEKVNITFNWNRVGSAVEFYWTKSEKLNKFSVTRKKATGSEPVKLIDSKEGCEFIDNEIDNTVDNEYVIKLIDNYGIAYDFKTITIPVLDNNKDNSKNSIENNEIDTVKESNKTSKEEKTILNEDKKGANENEKIDSGKERVLNESDKAKSESSGNGQNIETKSAVEALKNKNKDIIESTVDSQIKIDEEFLNAHKENVIFKYYIENKAVNENDLSIYRVIDGNNLLPVDGKVELDKGKKEIKVQIKEAGIYTIKEKSAAQKNVLKVDSSKYSDGTKKVKVEIDSLDIVLAGLFGYSDSEITKEEVDKYKTMIPQGNGIWIAEKDRSYIVDLINKSASKKYDVDTNGFLKVVKKNNEKNNKAENKKSDTFSSIIDSLINSNKKTIISRESSWLFFNKDNSKLEKAKITSNSGVNIGKSGTNQFVFIGKEEAKETGQVNAKNNVSNSDNVILFHELVHALRGEEGKRGKQEEEKYALEIENKMRKELGLKARDVDKSNLDILDGDNAVFNYDQDLDVGSTGPAVVELQTKLIKLGMDLGGYGATGYYGDYTVAAIKAIQQARKLPTVGCYGPATRKELFLLYLQLSPMGTYPDRSLILNYYNNNVKSLTSASTAGDLDKGASGLAVTKLQEKLIKLGFDLGGCGATGYFGSYIELALKAIQAYMGYETVGRYGPATRQAIEDLLLKVNTSSWNSIKNQLMDKYSQCISDVELDPGDEGIAVVELQKKLLRLGFDLGGCGATGYFGNYTAAALKAIQAYKFLPQIGRYGPGTRNALKLLLSHVNIAGNYPEKAALMKKYTEVLLNSDLDPGDEGAAVTELQKKLLKLGFDLGGYGATGYFGNYTTAALKAIQAYFKYETPGRYGPATRAAVANLLKQIDANGNYSGKAEMMELYNSYIKEFAASDATINVNGSYAGNYIYYDQEDKRWGGVPYSSGSDNIGNSGCGVTAMAMVESTINKNGVNPVEMANYSINNGFCYGYTDRSFFASVSTVGKYKLNCLRLKKGDIQTVKNLLSDGKHMAVAIMGQGYFTKCGHYIVLSGVSTIGGYNYFNVLDPHKDNPNYVTGGGLMIDNAASDGKVAARTSIFASQCEEYWVFSTAGSSTYDDMYKAKLNLEKLNYSGLRGSNGTLNSDWDKAFNNVLWQFLSDYGLKEKYNSLPDSEKKINLFIWIQQAVNGQRDKTTASGGNSEGKVDNNNSSNTQVVTISTMNSSFYDGVKEAVNSNKDSLWKMINNPFKTAVDLSKGVSFLAKALNPGTNENTLLAKIVYETIQKTSGDFISSNGNARAKMVGRAVGEIVIGLIGAKGLNVALDALKYAANTGKFMGIVNDVKAGKKCDDVYNAIKGVSSANFGSIEKLEGHFTKHRGEFKGIYNTADEYLQGARDVMNNGYKVQYKYKGEIRTGYVRFMENSGKGVAKFEFVGTNNAGEITTYHVESGKDFWKMLNGQNIPEINPID